MRVARCFQRRYKKKRDILWQKAQREQQGIEDLGRTLAKLGQHYVDLGENTSDLVHVARQHSLGHGLRSEVAMLVKFYAPELQEERDELDEQIRAFMAEVQKSLMEREQGSRAEDGTLEISLDTMRRLMKLPGLGAAIRDRCHEMMGTLAKLRHER
ncbi:MAG: hypothetical protein L0H19_03655 [Salinisphaera sp.]|nr:hypothetical protein [Salinisphaera sp.]